MTKGKYIVIEGIEGAGKSTLATALCKRLEAQGVQVLCTREPGGTAFAEDIRAAVKTPRDYKVDGLTEALAFSSARRDNYLNTVLPALESGTWVISDRSYLSMLAYQGYAQDNVSAVESLFELTYGTTFKFDYCFILDVDVATGLAKAKARDDKPCRIEANTVEFFERARSALADTRLISRYATNVNVVNMTNWFNANRSSDELAELFMHYLGD